MREELMAVKEQLEKVKEQSFAMELLKDQQKQNKRLFVICLVMFVAFILLLGYTLYLLNDITSEEIVTEEYEIKQDSGDNGNNNFINGNGNEVNNG